MIVRNKRFLFRTLARHVSIIKVCYKFLLGYTVSLSDKTIRIWSVILFVYSYDGED